MWPACAAPHAQFVTTSSQGTDLPPERDSLSQEGGHLRTGSNVLRLEFPEKTISLKPTLSLVLQLKKGTCRGAPRTWVPAQALSKAVANTGAFQTAWDNLREALESPKATYPREGN